MVFFYSLFLYQKVNVKLNIMRFTSSMYPNFPKILTCNFKHVPKK